MDVVAGTQVVLFESEADEEMLRIGVGVSSEGGLIIQQVSAGDLTAWCFEESPHEVRVDLAPEAVRALQEYFHARDLNELLRFLGVVYGGYDASQRIRGLLRRLGVPYQVVEQPIKR